jgi:hypothetical protein
VKNQRGPATVNESNLFNVTVLLLGWEDIGSDDHEPGNLPVFIAPMAYADRRVLSMQRRLVRFCLTKSPPF